MLLNSSSLAIVISVGFIIFVAAIQALFTYKREKRGIKNTDKEKFFLALDSKFELNLINGRDDILILLNSIAREFDQLYSIAPILEDYITNHFDIISKEKDVGKYSSELKERYTLLKKIISEENQDKPFKSAPDEERRLLVALRDGIQNDDTQSMQFNLDELNSVISARTKIYQRANLLNRWSVPMAILGLIMTILFGILSMTTSKLDSKQIDKVCDILIERVDDVNQTSLIDNE